MKGFYVSLHLFFGVVLFFDVYFAYPVLVVGVYCFLGLRFPGVSYNLFGKTFNGFWHPWWFLFLTIPVYYVIFGPIDEAIRNHRKNKVNIHINNDDVIEGEVK